MPPKSRVAVLPRPTLGPPPAPRVPHPERYALANGLRVVAAPRAGVPQVALRLVLPAGSVAEPLEHPGTASLVGHLLTEGTESTSADELHARLDLLGAGVAPSVGHDFTEVEVVLLSETLAEGIALLAEIVTRPTFPPDQTERIRAESLDALIARQDEPANVADDRALREAFGAHPYGTPSFGTAEGIRAVPREALAVFHAAHYRPAGALVVAAGEFDPDELREALQRGFAGWTGAAEPVAYPPPPARPANAGRLVVHPWADAEQSEIRVIGLGMERRHPDWIRAGVANFLLGGSTITGRLGANLREDKGWTYGVRSAFSAGMQPSGWLVETAVDVEVTADAVAETMREMRRLMDERVDDAELRRAKDALMLSLPRLFETPTSVAGRLSTLEAYDLPRDWWDRYPAAVEAVTADDVQRIAHEHFDPDKVVRVVVGAMEG
ncbi:MAG TPA: pitrilysin family protein [Longimicrobium sp.]|jgi:zinc protease|nr:pitrilysin family protein [Longimicrobium sp.]